MITNFNTLAAYESLKEAGLAEMQAKKIVQAIIDSQADLATKSDINLLRAELKNDLNIAMSNVNQRFDKLDLMIKGLFFMQALMIGVIGWLAANAIGKLS